MFFWSNFINRPSILFGGGDAALVYKYLHIRILGVGSYQVHTSWSQVVRMWFIIRTPRSSLGDVGEARWPLSHRWTDTSSTLPDAAHDSRDQGRVVSLSEPPLGVRPTLPAARGSSQLAAIAESLVTDATERSNRRVTCLLHIISDGTRVRHAQGITLSILRAFIASAVSYTHLTLPTKA